MWTESRRVRRRLEGTYLFPSGPTGGAGSIRVAAWIWSSSFHRAGDVKMEGGRMGSGSSGVGSGWCRRERATFAHSVVN